MIDFCIHSEISQKVTHLVKILKEQSLLSIKFSFKWLYFWAGKPCRCSSLYIEKIAKTICGRTWPFWGKAGAQRQKSIYLKFFDRNEVLNVFHIPIFSKKTTIFSIITEKNNFRMRGGAWPFFREWTVGTTKMNITFSMGNGAPITALKFFPQKSPYRLNESKKICFGGTFSPISVVLLDQLFTKKIGFTHVWTCPNVWISWKSVQNCDLYSDSDNYYKLNPRSIIF